MPRLIRPSSNRLESTPNRHYQRAMSQVLIVDVWSGVPPPTCYDSVPGSCILIASGPAVTDFSGHVHADVVAINAGQIGFTRLHHNGQAVADYLADESARHRVVVGMQMAINLTSPFIKQESVPFDPTRAATAIEAADREFT